MIKIWIKFAVLFPLDVLHGAFRLWDLIISNLLPQLKGVGRGKLINYIDGDIKVIKNDSVSFQLYTPNAICNFRHSTFFTKEPEMLEWIEEYGGGVFFDIGANIGIYSIYYSQIKDGNVYSFEPSVFNLRQLAKNISINNLSKRIAIITNPLSDKNEIASMINGSANEGGALSAFGVEYGHDGDPIVNDISYKILGFSLDYLFEINVLTEMPSLIKIDVDGIEHLILKGAVNTISSKKLKSIFVEVNDDFEEQAQQVKTILESAGFKLKQKRQSELIEGSVQFGRTYNQIWVKV